MPDWLRMKERLEEYFPEVSHLLTTETKIRAIHKDKWSRISAYIEACHMADVTGQMAPDWLDYKHNGQRVIRSHGQMTLAI